MIEPRDETDANNPGSSRQPDNQSSSSQAHESGQALVGGKRKQPGSPGSPGIPNKLHFHMDYCVS